MTDAVHVRRFQLIRTTDITKISGVGTIVVGVEWPDETCTLYWMKYATQGHYASIAQLKEIHCYDDNAKIKWIDKA